MIFIISNISKLLIKRRFWEVQRLSDWYIEDNENVNNSHFSNWHWKMCWFDLINRQAIWTKSWWPHFKDRQIWFYWKRIFRKLFKIKESWMNCWITSISGFRAEIWKQCTEESTEKIILETNISYFITFPPMWEAAEDLITWRCNPDWTWSDDYINNWEEISDSEIWKAIKEERRIKRLSNAEWSLNFLKEKWIEFTILSQSSFHVRVQHFDLYPTTWLFINMKTKKRWRWVKNLFNILSKQIWKDQT